MDPAMMGGGMPPADPSMGGGGTPVTLNLEDLQQIVQELAKGGGAEGGEGEGESKRVTNRQVMDEITMLKEQLSALAAGMGIQLPAGDVGAGGDTSVSPDMSSPEDLEAAALGDEMMADATGGAPAPGGDALAGDPAFEALNAGLPPGEGMPKLAATSWLASTRLGR